MMLVTFESERLLFGAHRILFHDILVRLYAQFLHRLKPVVLRHLDWVPTEVKE